MIVLAPKQKKAKMIDNSLLVSEFLDFSEEGTFYFLQILKRRKDNPDLDKDCVHVADFYITSLKQFEKVSQLCKGICEKENARAYLRLNRRDNKKLAFQVLKRIADNIASGNFEAVKGAYAACTGEFCHDSTRKWIVDIDWKDWENRAEVGVLLVPFIEGLQEEAGNDPISKILPTRNGIHIITHPFNVEKFKEKYPFVEVHKDNPTILFCPL